MKINIKYWYDDFKNLKVFDLLSLEELSDKFKSVNNKIKKKASHTAGWNTNYLNSDKDDIKKNEFWNGYNPEMHFIEKFGKKGFQVKSDISSMIMDGYKKDWDFFMYLFIPNYVMEKYFKSTHDNEDISYIKKFVNEVENTIGWDKDYYHLLKKYDEMYPEKKKYNTFFSDLEEYNWRADFIVEQFISIKNKGLIFPIIYNNKKSIFNRGTHRALACQLSGYDVPFFIQVNLKDILKVEYFTVETESVFTFGKLFLDVYYNQKKIIYKNKLGDVLYEVCY